MTSLNEMEEMIVCPMTCFDDRASFIVPGQSVRIARSLGDDLKLVRARMHPPQCAVELVFSPVVRPHAALVEHAVQPIEPAIRTPRQRIRQLVRIGPAKTG